MSRFSYRNIGPKVEHQDFARHLDHHSCPVFCNTRQQLVTFLPFPHLLSYFDINGEHPTTHLETLLRLSLGDRYRLNSLKAVYYGYLRVFATLIYIGKSDFIQLFLQRQTLRDDKLPFDHRPTDLPEEIWDDFYQAQWQFCAHPFADSDTEDVTLMDGEILPFENRTEIGRGQSACVYVVQLHPYYNHLHDSEGGEGASEGENNSHRFVLKSYDSTDPDALECYKSELRAFQHIGDQEGIVRFYGSFRQGATCNVILEYADQGNLEEYMRAYRGPRTQRDISNFWNNIFELTKALTHIHQVSPDSTHPFGVFQGWHQDIKPENILVFSDGQSSPYAFKFKLADLGLSQLEQSQQNAAGTTTTYKTGTRTYSDPELFQARMAAAHSMKIRQAVDLWSMACVFSVVSTWVVEDWEEVERYREVRMRASGRGPEFDSDTDCFHDGNKVLQEVEDWHLDLEERCRQGDRVTRHLWGGLLSRTFVPWDQRPSAMSFMTFAISLANTSSPSTSQHDRNSSTWGINPTFTSRTMTTLDRAQSSTQRLDRNPRISSPTGIGSNTRSRISFHPSNTSAGSIQHQPTIAEDRTFSDPPTVFQDINGRSSTHHTPFQRNDVHSDSTIQSGHLRSTQSTLPDPSELSSFSSVTSPSTSTHFQQNNNAKDAVPSDHTLNNRPIRRAEERVERLPPDRYRNSFDHQLVNAPTPANGALQQATGRSQHCLLHPARKPIPRWSFDEFAQYKVTKKIRKIPNEYLKDQVKARDHIILVDNTDSMKQYSEQLIRFAGALAYFVKDLDDDEIELYFTCGRERHFCATSTALVAHIKNNSSYGNPGADSDPSGALHQIFDDHHTSLRDGKQKRTLKIRRGPRLSAPITIYFLTDGLWRSQTNLTNVIKRMVNFLVEHGKSSNHIGIEFIQFGNDAKATEKLEWYDDLTKHIPGLAYDIVDTEHNTGNVWKILLGSVDPTFDAHKEPPPGTKCTCGEQQVLKI